MPVFSGKSRFYKWIVNDSAKEGFMSNTQNHFTSASLLHTRALPALLAALYLLVGATICCAQTFTVPDTSAQRRVVRGWVDTGIDLPRGRRVQLSASGNVDVGGGYGRFAAEGTTAFANVPGYPAETRYRYGLVARLTESRDNPEDELREDYAYGETRQFCARAGHLWLTVNDNYPSDNTGAFTVQVTIGSSCYADRPLFIPPDARSVTGDIWVTGMEVTQAVQTYPGNQIPLVGYKRTVVRVYLQSRDDVRGPWTDVTGRLTVRNISGSHAGGPIRDRVLLPSTNDSRAAITASTTGSHRDRWDDSLNFVLDLDQTASGEREFQVDISTIAGRPETNVTNNSLPRPLRVRFENIPGFSVFGVTYRTSRLAAAPWSHLEAPRRYSENIFPVANLWIVPWPGNPIPTFDSDPEPGLTAWDKADAWAADLLNTRYPEGGRRIFILQPDLDRGYHGLASPCACPGPGINITTRSTDNIEDPGPTMAHEIAHSWGRPHTFDPGGFPRSDFSLGNQVGIRTNTGLFGWGVELLPGQTADGRPARYDLMSYNAPFWATPFTYCELMARISGGRVSCADDVLRAQTPAEFSFVNASFNHLNRSPSWPNLAGDAVVSRSISTPQKERTFLYVSGWITPDGTAIFRPFEMKSSSTDMASQSQGNTYHLDLEDTTGQLLSTRGFDTPAPADYVKGSPVLFTMFVPYAPSTARIILRQGDKILASRTVSSNYPEVKLILEPKLGVGKQTISWEATDPDGDPLTFSLEYSADGGQTWIPLNKGMTETATEIDFQALPGSDEALLRILVSDGVNTSEARTRKPFRVPRKSPQVTLSIEKGDIVLDKPTLVLEGKAFDWEDGPIANTEAFVWSSDRDGILGFGPWIVLSKLSSGKQRITLTVYDSDKNSATASIDITGNKRKR
jgi:hypothetical protein